MTLVTDIRRTVTDNTAVYVAVGITDLAVEKVRDARERAAAARAGVLRHRAPGPRRRPGAAGPHAGLQPHARDRRPGPGVLRRPRRARREAGQAPAHPEGHAGPDRPGRDHRPPRQGRRHHRPQGRRRDPACRPRDADHRPPRGRRRRRDRRRVGAGRGRHQRQGRAQVGRRHPHARPSARPRPPASAPPPPSGPPRPPPPAPARRPPPRPRPPRPPPPRSATDLTRRAQALRRSTARPVDPRVGRPCCVRCPLRARPCPVRPPLGSRRDLPDPVPVRRPRPRPRRALGLRGVGPPRQRGRRRRRRRRSLLSVGDVTGPTFPRSSNKPLQALAMVRAGLDLDGELLALASASHSGEPFHLDGVRRILDGAGLNEDDLQNTPDLPLRRGRAPVLGRRRPAGQLPGPELLRQARGDAGDLRRRTAGTSRRTATRPTRCSSG